MTTYVGYAKATSMASNGKTELMVDPYEGVRTKEREKVGRVITDEILETDKDKTRTLDALRHIDEGNLRPWRRHG